MEYVLYIQVKLGEKMDWFLYDNGLRHERVNGSWSVIHD